MSHQAHDIGKHDSAFEHHEMAVQEQKESSINSNGEQVWDEPRFENMTVAEQKAFSSKLVRKIDLILMPTLVLIFVFNILDRSNISQARLKGLEKDLKLTDTQFDTCISILFVGYLSFQLPSNLILTRVRPNLYLPICMVIWGTISACTAVAKNYTNLLLIRFFLGFAEAPFFSGALLILSAWYTRREMAPRIAIMYSGNTLANAFGGLLAAGILKNLEGAHGIRGWRWLFIIEGTCTVGLALVAFFLLPNFPADTKWLSEQERRFCSWRMTVDANGEEDTKSSIGAGVLAAVTDYKVWLLVAIQLCLLTSQTYSFFFPTIVKTLGKDTTTTLLLTAPPYFAGFFTSLINSLVAAKTGKRTILIVWPLVVAAIGDIIVISTLKTAPRYFGMFLMVIGSYSAFNVVLSWVSATIPRPQTKRAVSLAMVNMIANCSNIYGSYFFPSKSGPKYRSGGIALIAFALAGAVLACVLGAILHRENKKTEALERQDGVKRYKYLI
ncbi:protein of unknown function [Taphrina deformans PYCC 5710]|uniref:Major facilitator superfamily (MFS) profile domain-containing protein n=1 Tax=Taphrina deformans (strain PYCC 5710 / ATCC 11124 / CBS 356.35 / IMI 108563 / JCM 9778 / NBRC 8474) TaxID=1097556 RepID=R4XFB5_TAPDE|nr:protein of unknown function [Taphrina deformans PYCC 5710]|eukprot:CCG84471.1 protein of unknown function [Taphrina deformans PYCC 5710]